MIARRRRPHLPNGRALEAPGGQRPRPAVADIPAVEDVRQAVFVVLAKNGMTDGVHIRLTLSRA